MQKETIRSSQSSGIKKTVGLITQYDGEKGKPEILKELDNFREVNKDLEFEFKEIEICKDKNYLLMFDCLLYTSPSPRD